MSTTSSRASGSSGTALLLRRPLTGSLSPRATSPTPPWPDSPQTVVSPPRTAPQSPSRQQSCAPARGATYLDACRRKRNVAPYDHADSITPAEAQALRAAAGELRGEVFAWLTDDGVGFDMGYAAHLFGAFQRMHPPGEFGGD